MLYLVQSPPSPPSSIFNFSRFSYIYRYCKYVNIFTVISTAFWAYRYIYLVNLSGTERHLGEGGGGACQKNVKNLIYRDWFKMHFPACSKVTNLVLKNFFWFLGAHADSTIRKWVRHWYSRYFAIKK